MLSGEELSELLGSDADIETICADLVFTANNNGGRDNISVILARVETFEAQAWPLWAMRLLTWLKSCIDQFR
jgi:protein phosphatase